MKTVLIALALIATQPSQAPGPTADRPLHGFLRVSCNVEVDAFSKGLGINVGQVESALMSMLRSGGLSVVSPGVQKALAKEEAAEYKVPMDGDPVIGLRKIVDQSSASVWVTVQSVKTGGNGLCGVVTVTAYRLMRFYNNNAAVTPVYTQAMPFFASKKSDAGKAILGIVENQSATLAKKIVLQSTTP